MISGSGKPVEQPVDLLRFKLLHLFLVVLAELVALQEGLDGVGAGGVLIRAQLELFDLGGFVEKTFVAA